MPRLPEISLIGNIIYEIGQLRRETEEAWRLSELELKADRHGYDLYQQMQAGTITSKELEEKIIKSKDEFGYDLVHVRYGAQYAQEHKSQRVGVKV